jgi:hypothetical protein
MRAMKAYVVLLAVCGCAKGAPEAGILGDGVDAGVMQRPDSGTPVIPPDAAPLPDAPVGMQTRSLSQTTDTTVVASNVGCYYEDPLFGFVYATDENSWYRVFRLADHGITSAFTVQRVTFYTDWALGTNGQQPGTVRVGTYAGTLNADTLDPAQITVLATQNITIPDADSTAGQPAPVVTDIAATIPANGTLIVEVAAPDGYASQSIFFIGVSAGGEAKKGYIRSSGCTAINAPTAVATILPNKAVLIDVTGTSQ